MTPEPPATRRLVRRTWLQACLTALGAQGLAATAPTPGAPYLRLKEPVSIAVGDLQLWRPHPFSAWVDKPAAEGEPAAERLLKGILVQASEKPGPESLRALCLHCPHELCYVQLVEELHHVRLEQSARPDHPLLVCPCHFSVFDPQKEGALLEGPSERGLFRFRFQMRDDVVEIQEVEAAAVL